MQNFLISAHLQIQLPFKKVNRIKLNKKTRIQIPLITKQSLTANRLSQKRNQRMSFQISSSPQNPTSSNKKNFQEESAKYSITPTLHGWSSENSRKTTSFPWMNNCLLWDAPMSMPFSKIMKNLKMLSIWDKHLLITRLSYSQGLKLLKNLLIQAVHSLSMKRTLFSMILISQPNNTMNPIPNT